MLPLRNPSNRLQTSNKFKHGPIKMHRLKGFGAEQIKIVNNAVAMAEELVSNHYKMSASQWLGPRYDVKTLADLNPDEIITSIM